jgi:hypothetical protein
VDQLGEVLGWDLDFRQLDSGALCVRAIATSLPCLVTIEIDWDRGFHQRGQAPLDGLSFGFMRGGLIGGPAGQ